MKKTIFFTIISALWFSVNAQVTELKGGMGLDFGANKEAAKTMMKEKHPDAVFDEDKNNNMFYAGGTWLSKKVALWGFLFSKSQELHTIIVQVEPFHQSDAFDNYDQVVRDLTTKYGQPTGVIENWRYPYEKKDKYDHGIVAVKNGKCTMMTYWQWPNAGSTELVNNTILVEITTYLDTKVTYQDGLRIKEVKKERSADMQDEM